MNAAAAAPDEQLTEAAGNRSDSDTDLDEDDSSEYYQPISSVENGHHESYSSDDDEESFNHHQLPNGHAPMENQLSSLDLTDDDENEQEEQETEMERAMREDERRRNAPLPPETADRVREAMRGVQFGGPVPQWAGRIPEDDLIYRVRDRARRALLAAHGLIPNRRNP